MKSYGRLDCVFNKASIAAALSVFVTMSLAGQSGTESPPADQTKKVTKTWRAAETRTDANVRQVQIVEEEEFQPPPPQDEDINLTSLFGSASPAPDVNELLADQPERKEVAEKPSATMVTHDEAVVRASTDTGDLIVSSQQPTNVAAQRRNAVSTELRVRGYRHGQTLGYATGALWVPARLDLDTVLSKIDSGITQDVIVLQGPYSSRYGPGFSFIDIQTAPTPRHQNGFQWNGRTYMNYETNGDQLYGRQSVSGGAGDWGFRMGYGHRTGSDYETGDGDTIPSSYKVRDVDVAFGLDLSPDSHIEFGYLRLDQTDTEFPGEIFDIEALVTNGYTMQYVLENQCYFDRLTVDAWHNYTWLEGNTFRTGKRDQIPFLDQCPAFKHHSMTTTLCPTGIGLLAFSGETDSNMMSTGYRAAMTWGQSGCPEFTAGVDLRYLEQEFNEIDQFDNTGAGGPPNDIRNRAIPRSHSSNPGAFVEQVLPVNECLTVTTGARIDWVSTDIEGQTRLISNAALHTLLGVDNFDQHFLTAAAYMTADLQIDDHWNATAAFGTAGRPPILPELYAADPFFAILQQGFVQVRGNPELDAEQAYQFDFGLNADFGRFRGGMRLFHSWIHDYITFEAINADLANIGVPDGLGIQFVNTDWATLAGGELYAEYDWNEWLTPFATLFYVEGRDHTRNGRGVIAGSDDEPLPTIPPLEGRFGFRLHQPCPAPKWGIEFTSRVVDNQDRVASSLLERPTAGFTTYDIRGYVQATEGLTLVAGVQNLTDKYYNEHLDLRTGRGVFQPGISYYFGFELLF